MSSSRRVQMLLSGRAQRLRCRQTGNQTNVATVQDARSQWAIHVGCAGPARPLVPAGGDRSTDMKSYCIIDVLSTFNISLSLRRSSVSAVMSCRRSSNSSRSAALPRPHPCYLITNIVELCTEINWLCRQSRTLSLRTKGVFCRKVLQSSKLHHVHVSYLL